MVALVAPSAGDVMLIRHLSALQGTARAQPENRYSHCT